MSEPRPGDMPVVESRYNAAERHVIYSKSQYEKFSKKVGDGCARWGGLLVLGDLHGAMLE